MNVLYYICLFTFFALIALLMGTYMYLRKQGHTIKKYIAPLIVNSILFYISIFILSIAITGLCLPEVGHKLQLIITIFGTLTIVFGLNILAYIFYYKRKSIMKRREYLLTLLYSFIIYLTLLLQMNLFGVGS